MILLASSRGTTVPAASIADLQALVALAFDADVTVTTGTTGGGTWSILCFVADPAAYPVLIERRGDSRGVNPAADALRSALVALDPAFGLEPAPAGPAPKPR